MFGMISFNKYSVPRTNPNELVEFYALTWNGKILEYFTTYEALKVRVEEYRLAQEEKVDTLEAFAEEDLEFRLPDFRLECE